MGKQFRIVSTHAEGITEILNDGKKDGKCKLGGKFGEMITKGFRRVMDNCTIRQVEGYGHFKNGSYTDGLGLVQDGTVDAPAVHMYYPPPIDEIEFAYPMHHEHTEIGSQYNTTVGGHTVDVVDMLGTFNALQWGYVSIVLFVFFCVLHVGQKYFKGIKRPDAAWIVTMFFLDQDFLNEIFFYLKILSFTMSFFSFFIMQYLQNIASTDLVVMDEPKTVKTYQDIIDFPGLRPIFLKGHPESDAFEYAPEGSDEKKLWDAFWDKDIFMEPQIDTLIQTFEQFLKSQFVFISRDANVEAAAYLACCMMREDRAIKDLNVMISMNPGTAERIVGLIYNRDLDPEFKRQIHIGALRLLESGQPSYAFKDYIKGLAPVMNHEIESCVTRSVPDNESPEPFVPLKSTAKLFTYYGYALCISAAVLLLEIIYDSIKRQYQEYRHRRKNTRKVIRIMSRPKDPKMEVAVAIAAAHFASGIPDASRRKSITLQLAKRVPEEPVVVRKEVIKPQHLVQKEPVPASKPVVVEKTIEPTEGEVQKPKVVVDPRQQPFTSNDVKPIKRLSVTQVMQSQKTKGVQK